MNAKFTYVGICVRNLQKSIDFYTKLLCMKVVSRGKVEKTKGETVALVSREGGFVLELNHYEKDSPYSTKYAVGEDLTILHSELTTWTRHCRKQNQPDTTQY